MQYENLEEIKVESFWGAIASLIFFQIFGYIIFQSFISYLDDFFMLFYGGVWLLVLLYFQSKMMAKIQGFLSKKSITTATLSIRKVNDWFKFILSIFFIAILILFFFGFYPFPQKEFDTLNLLIFYVFSLIVSSVFAITIQKMIPQTRELKYQGSLAGGFCNWVCFCFISLFF
jgi:hypothetical protein